MRVIKISTPKNFSSEVTKLAFSKGIEEVSIYQVEIHHSESKFEIRDVIDIQTSTPQAKAFTDALINADFYNRTEFSISTEQPLSIISGENLLKLTRPLNEPTVDIFEELMQFTHITISFTGRVFIAGCLLAFGIINAQILIMIAGLLFLPLLPLLLAISFGISTRQKKLALHGITALLIATFLLILAGSLTASFSFAPVKYAEFNSLLSSFLISLAVGIAAVLANIDDVGKRELIGLAATAQIAIIPVWLGICLILGTSPTIGEREFEMRIIAFIVNVLTIIGASAVTYISIGAANQLNKKINI